ncbi:hypothetical protein B0J12DRAFT_25408 [Macrophomina phaseolina]|uniref:BED-type domain-containing protein n=1 Tax=Macrophomina phaseolina TaxID=35725 RepID=A0ABQ8GY70_9PEZI|nr:hypothetical protein B0J12DRAFT_25408 [Macrophomina phaseolina]
MRIDELLRNNRRRDRTRAPGPSTPPRRSPRRLQRDASTTPPLQRVLRSGSRTRQHDSNGGEGSSTRVASTPTTPSRTSTSSGQRPLTPGSRRARKRARHEASSTPSTVLTTDTSLVNDNITQSFASSTTVADSPVSDYSNIDVLNPSRLRTGLTPNTTPDLMVNRTSFTWRHGHCVIDDERRVYWVCKICHANRSTHNHTFNVQTSTSSAITHLKRKHRVTPPSSDNTPPLEVRQERASWGLVTASL